jgi:hypothetical protein
VTLATRVHCVKRSTIADCESVARAVSLERAPTLACPSTPQGHNGADGFAAGGWPRYMRFAYVPLPRPCRWPGCVVVPLARRRSVLRQEVGRARLSVTRPLTNALQIDGQSDRGRTGRSESEARPGPAAAQ